MGDVLMWECVVVNMAKEKQWEDVRLLSFDLQTVKFAYAPVRTTPTSCTTLLTHNVGLHTLHLPQGPATDGRFVQPPLWASPIPR
jgi:hypothetical protein